jgi:integrase
MGVKVREKISGSGIWWVFVASRGKRTSKLVGSRKAAREAASRIEREIALERFHLETPEEAAPIRFGEYAEKWFASHVEINLKGSTSATYRILLDNHILPTFKDLSLAKISRDQVKALCYGKGKSGLSGRSIHYIARTISAIFNHAIEDGLLQANPAARPGRYIKTGSRRDTINFLTTEEVKHLLDTCKTVLPRFYPFLFTALRTGLRKGELIALQWEDIDWQGKFIEVRRSCWDGKFTTPKSGKSRRVDISDQLFAVLRAWKVQKAGVALSKGEPFGNLMFPSEKGTFRDPSHVVRDLRTVLKKAGLRRIRFHDLRHTYASLLLQNRESPVYVKEQLGHHSIQITVDTYGHLVPGANREAVNRLDDLLEKPAEPAPQAHPPLSEEASTSPPSPANA